MITLVLLLLFTYGYFTGRKRGSALQLFYSIAYTIAYFISATQYKKLGEQLNLWIPFPSATSETKMMFFDQKTSFELDNAFYAGVAFVLLFLGLFILIRFLGIFVHKLHGVTLFGTKDKLFAGLLGVFAIYMSCLFVLILGSMIPMNSIQNALSHDLLANAMIERTPFFSGDLHRLWITNIIG